MNPFSPEEIQEIRRLFPVTENFIYLNHAAVGPLSVPAVQAAQEFLEEALHLGYTAGPQWTQRIESARHAAADLIGASPEEVAFVKSTSHGLSLIARGLNFIPRDEIVLSETEFPSNVYPWMALEPRGVILKKIPSEAGELKLDRFKSLLSSRTRVVSLSSVQYGNGFRLPLDFIGKICRERGILFCVDGIQSLGAFPLDVAREHVDVLAADAHKWMLGPEGVGILYVRGELLPKIEPVLVGWNSVVDPLSFDKVDFTLKKDARRFEEGSLNTLSISALGAALALILQIGVERIARRILYLTDLLIEGLQGMGLVLTCSLKPAHRSGIVTFQLPADPKGKRLPSLEKQLFAQKIYTSVRCGSLRLSPHFYNSEEEIQKTLEVISHFLRVPPPEFSRD